MNDREVVGMEQTSPCGNRPRNAIAMGKRLGVGFSINPMMWARQFFQPASLPSANERTKGVHENANEKFVVV
jgi:hypothetical protein